jgi:hypothetical protein
MGSYTGSRSRSALADKRRQTFNRASTCELSNSDVPTLPVIANNTAFSSVNFFTTFSILILSIFWSETPQLNDLLNSNFTNAKLTNLAMFETLQGSTGLNILNTKNYPLPPQPADFKYTTFDNFSALEKIEATGSWGDFVNLIKNPKNYPAKAACPWIKLATFGNGSRHSGCLRHDANVVAVTGIEGDYDGEKLSIRDARDTLNVCGVRAVLYTSASHTTDKPRWRVLLPLSRPHSPGERHALVARLNGLLGGVLAPESFTLSQSYFFGRVVGTAYEAYETQGDCIDEIGMYELGAIGPKPPKLDDMASPSDGMILPPLTERELTDLKSAAMHLARAGHGNNYPEWASTGQALKAESIHGREVELKALWLEYSRACTGFENEAAVEKKWAQLDGTKSGKGAIFQKAQNLGWINPATGKVPTNSSRYKLLTGTDLRNLPPMVWLVHGVLPAIGLASIYGPSKAGKSFLCIDLACAIAEGNEWFRHRVTPAPVVYVALEGEAGFRQRAGAWEVKNGRTLPDGVKMVMQPFNLTTAQDVADLSSVVPTGAVVFLDTLRRAAPTADENASKDMGEIIEGAKRLMVAINGLVIVVHHTGKNESQGMRGHSSLLGALDASIEVSRDGERRSWKSDKVKEGEDGGISPFKLEIVNVGFDDDNEMITSCVVVTDTSTVTREMKGLKHVELVVLETLTKVLATNGIAAPSTVSHNAPLFDNSLRVVPEQLWKQACYEAGITNPSATPDAKLKAFKRARGELLSRNMIQISGGYVWKI